MKNLQKAGVSDEVALCLNFDGRRDKIKFMTNGEATGKYCKGERMEEHYCLTIEPSEKFADHFTPEAAAKNETCQALQSTL